MGIRKFKPTSAGVRFRTGEDFSELTRARPHKPLTRSVPNKAGRGGGRISSYNRGGGHKRRYRKVDFRRDKSGVPARVASIEYDPYRSARIALVHYADGEKRYIVACEGLSVGDKIVSGEGAEVSAGNCLKLREIPTGIFVHNVELRPGGGAQVARSAGCSIQIAAKEKDRALLKLPSGEIRTAGLECMATVGRVGNSEHELVSIGKAGRNRHRRRRPNVRGVAMNPVDHPHGGGEGKAAKGNPHPVSPWGWITIGYKTRRNKRTDKHIIKSRRVGYGMD